MGEIRISVNSGELPVVHDVGGISENLRKQTRWLAQAGFLAAVLDLMFRGGKMKCVCTIMRDQKARQGPTPCAHGLDIIVC
jgi:dienelactone hydrolase